MLILTSKIKAQFAVQLLNASGDWLNNTCTVCRWQSACIELQISERGDPCVFSPPAGPAIDFVCTLDPFVAYRSCFHLGFCQLHEFLQHNRVEYQFTHDYETLQTEWCKAKLKLIRKVNIYLCNNVVQFKRTLSQSKQFVLSTNLPYWTCLFMILRKKLKIKVLYNTFKQCWGFSLVTKIIFRCTIIVCGNNNV